MAPRPTRAALASSPEIEAAAAELLRRGNAVDAVVAALFAACATSPSALLGPAQILVGGAGAGLRAFDGRVRQPGIGAPRPRGFVTSEEVPDGARVGAPWLPATLAAALATAGSQSVAQVMGPALALAKGTARADVLARIAARGPRAIEERPLSTELLAAAGRAASGLLTADDLASPRPEVLPAARHTRATRMVIAVPWAHFDDGVVKPPAAQVDIGSARVIVVVDRHGTFALASWEDAPEGLRLDELGLRVPLFAEPVRRGQPRVRPGDPRAAAAPMVLTGRDGVPEVALAAFGAGDAYAVLNQALASLLDDDRIEGHGESRLVALSHAKGIASSLRS